MCEYKQGLYVPLYVIINKQLRNNIGSVYDKVQFCLLVRWYNVRNKTGSIWVYSDASRNTEIIARLSITSYPMITDVHFRVSGVAGA
jgi:hypothetical protein